MKIESRTEEAANVPSDLDKVNEDTTTGVCDNNPDENPVLYQEHSVRPKFNSNQVTSISQFIYLIVQAICIQPHFKCIIALLTKLDRSIPGLLSVSHTASDVKVINLSTGCNEGIDV